MEIRSLSRGISKYEYSKIVIYYYLPLRTYEREYTEIGECR